MEEDVDRPLLPQHPMPCQGHVSAVVVEVALVVRPCRRTVQAQASYVAPVRKRVVCPAFEFQSHPVLVEEVVEDRRLLLKQGP